MQLTMGGPRVFQPFSPLGVFSVSRASLRSNPSQLTRAVGRSNQDGYMRSMRFIENEEKFLEYSWSVFQEYFKDKASFLEKYYRIESAEKKNWFLRLASYYLFFVVDGNYSSPKYDVEDLSFVDQTYKFIAIVALIESIYDKNDYIDFYQWIMRNRKNGLFPISDEESATKLYSAYKAEHGNTLNMVRFFQSLDDSIKSFIQRSLVVLDDSGKTGELEEKQ